MADYGKTNAALFGGDSQLSLYMPTGETGSLYAWYTENDGWWVTYDIKEDGYETLELVTEDHECLGLAMADLLVQVKDLAVEDADLSKRHSRYVDEYLRKLVLAGC